MPNQGEVDHECLCGPQRVIVYTQYLTIDCSFSAFFALYNQRLKSLFWQSLGFITMHSLGLQVSYLTILSSSIDNVMTIAHSTHMAHLVESEKGERNGNRRGTNANPPQK